MGGAAIGRLVGFAKRFGAGEEGKRPVLDGPALTRDRRPRTCVMAHLIERDVNLIRTCRNHRHRVRGRFTGSSKQVLEKGPPTHGTRRCDGVPRSFSLFCVFSHTITTPLSVDALKSLVPRPLRCVREVACAISDWSRFSAKAIRILPYNFIYPCTWRLFLAVVILAVPTDACSDPSSAL